MNFLPALRLKTSILLLLACFVGSAAYPQADSAQSELSFDFGITRGRNINLWPVLYRMKSCDKKELQILYPIFSKTTDFKNHSSRFMFLPFAVNDSSAQSVNKRYGSLKYPSLYHYQREQYGEGYIRSHKVLELAPNISCLGISRSPDGMFVENNMFFFIWYKRDQAAQKTRIIVFPAYWYLSTAKDTTKVLVPFYVVKNSAKRKQVNIGLVYNYSRDRFGNNRSVFPLYWHSDRYYSNDTLTKTTLFPVYWSQKSADVNNKVYFPLVYRHRNTNYSSTTVAPFFSYGSRTDGRKKHLMVTPLYWHLTDPYDTKDVVFPLYWRNEEYRTLDTVVHNTLFPVYWARKSNFVDNKILLPVVYSLRNRRYQSLTVFPLVSFGHSTDSSVKHLVLTPLYWHVKEDNETHDVVFPLFWRTHTVSRYDTVTHSTLFPLYWSRQSKIKGNKVLFPLVYKLKNPYYQSYTFVPLFSYGHNADSTRRHLVVTPLYWHIAQRYRTYDVLFPLYWRNTKVVGNDTVKHNTVFPFYWSTKSNERNNKVLFPFVYSLRDNEYRSLSVLPLFSVGRSSDSTRRHFDILQIYWHLRSSDTETRIVFPLWYRHDHFWTDDTLTRRALVPIYWSAHSKDKRNDIIFPLVYKLKNDTRHSFTVAPFCSFGGKNDSTARYFAVTPLYWHIEKPGKINDVCLPLYWRKKWEQDGDTATRSTVFPLYWSLRSGTKNYNVLFPLYWRSRKMEWGDTVTRTTVFPIFWAQRSALRNNTVLFPLAFRLKDGHYRSLTVVPLFSYGRSADSTERHLVLTPLLWRVRHNGTLRNVAFPFIWTAQNERKNNKVLFPLIYSLHNQHYTSLTVAPLFSYGHSADTSVRHLMVTPLYWHIVRQGKRSDVLFPLYWSSREIRRNDTVVKKTVFPMYWATKNKDKDNKILFPLAFCLKNARYRSFTLFPLFSTGQSADAKRKHLMLTPLAGRFLKDSTLQAFVFPLCTYKKTSAETRTSVLYMLMRRQKSAHGTRTALLWPIIERVKADTLRSFRIAPVLWSSRTDTSRVFSVQPFTYSYRSATRKTFMFCWFVYRYDRVAEVSVAHSVLWKLYNRKKYSNGDHETRVLHLLYADIAKDGRTEKSLLPLYHRVDDANGDRSKSVCFGFYNYFKQYIPAIKESYEEERIFWFVRLRSNYAKLKSEGKGEFLKRK